MGKNIAYIFNFLRPFLDKKPWDDKWWRKFYIEMKGPSTGYLSENALTKKEEVLKEKFEGLLKKIDNNKITYLNMAALNYKYINCSDLEELANPEHSDEASNLIPKESQENKFSEEDEPLYSCFG